MKRRSVPGPLSAGTHHGTAIYSWEKGAVQAWFKIGLFRVTVTDPQRSRLDREFFGIAHDLRAAPLVAGEQREAQHLQPVGMGLTAQQFGGAFADALGVLTAQEATEVEKELEQSQVVGPQVAA